MKRDETKIDYSNLTVDNLIKFARDAREQKYRHEIADAQVKAFEELKTLRATLAHLQGQAGADSCADLAVKLNAASERIATLEGQLASAESRLASGESRLRGVLHSSICTKCGWAGEPLIANLGRFPLTWLCGNPKCGYEVTEPKSQTIATLEGQIAEIREIAEDFADHRCDTGYTTVARLILAVLNPSVPEPDTPRPQMPAPPHCDHPDRPSGKPLCVACWNAYRPSFEAWSVAFRASGLAILTTANEQPSTPVEERVHVKFCDEYHAHEAPKCCSISCWCRTSTPETEPSCARCGQVQTARGGDVHCSGDCDQFDHEEEGSCHRFTPFPRSSTAPAG